MYLLESGLVEFKDAEIRAIEMDAEPEAKI
jgi:hypothetical protein